MSISGQESTILRPLLDGLLSHVLEYVGDPAIAELPEWQEAGSLVAGRIWQEIRGRPHSPVGTIANTLDILPIATDEKLRRLADQVHNEFAYRSQLDLATWAVAEVYDPKWADQVDAHLNRLDLEEADDVLTAMASYLWKVDFDNPFSPVEQAFPPEVVQMCLGEWGISNQLTVEDVHFFLEFLRSQHFAFQPHNRLTSADMAYLKQPKTKLLISAYFRARYRVEAMSKLNRFPSIFIRDFRPEKLSIEGSNCRFPLRFPPNCLRVLHLSHFGDLHLPEGAFDGMKNLKELHLAHNSMTSLPESLGDLPQLRILDLKNNLIRVIPPSFFDSLPSLECIDLRDNPLNPKRIDAPHRVDVLRFGFNNNTPFLDTIVQKALSIKRTGEWLMENRAYALLGLLLLTLYLYCSTATFSNT